MAMKIAQVLYEKITVPSPIDPRLYAEVEEVPDGVHVVFYKTARGSGAGPVPKILSQGVIDDKPFHAVLDHVHRILSTQR